ncbi:MAG: hypothetical protein ACTHLW_11405 [Verrucomicrobiota bacterium]
MILLLSGCEGRDIQVSKVAKENPVAPIHADAVAHETAAQPPLKWTTPEGWTEGAPGELRVASFNIKGQGGKQAELSIIPLSGMAGGDLNNFNRWRSQVSLPAVTAEAFAALGEKVGVGGADATLYDLAGTAVSGDETRILATVLHRDGMAWFFKMIGDDELVASQKAAFIGFLASLEFAAADAVAALPPDHPPIGGGTATLPPNHPPIGGATPMTEASTENSARPQWVVPAGWTEEPPSQMLLAKFSTGQDAARAEITVSSFPGDVGGLLANVNRWRRQMGLPAIDEAQMNKDVKSLDLQGEKGSLVELDGATASGPASLMGVSVPHAGQTWFFKMTGDGKVVAREKEAFIQFVQTLKLPNAL